MECASGWGKVRDKMKCASGWGKVKKLFFFRKCASGWGNSKKGKMLKMGGTMFVHKASIHKHSSPPFLTL